MSCEYCNKAKNVMAEIIMHCLWWDAELGTADSSEENVPFSYCPNCGEPMNEPEAQAPGEETAMDKITTAMMEHICDNLCQHSQEMTGQEQLDAICASCKMGYLRNILDEHISLAGELERAHKNALQMAGELMREKDKRQWVPVEERLPEKDARVLVYRPNMCGTDVGPMSVLSGWQCYNKRTDIAAWTPLPDKPEEV